MIPTIERNSIRKASGRDHEDARVGGRDDHDDPDQTKQVGRTAGTGVGREPRAERVVDDHRRGARDRRRKRGPTPSQATAANPSRPTRRRSRTASTAASIRSQSDGQGHPGQAVWLDQLRGQRRVDDHGRIATATGVRVSLSA